MIGLDCHREVLWSEAFERLYSGSCRLVPEHVREVSLHPCLRHVNMTKRTGHRDEMRIVANYVLQCNCQIKKCRYTDRRIILFDGSFCGSTLPTNIRTRQVRSLILCAGRSCRLCLLLLVAVQEIGDLNSYQQALTPKSCGRPTHHGQRDG